MFFKLLSSFFLLLLCYSSVLSPMNTKTCEILDPVNKYDHF